jgi:hypothetical protein
MKPAQAIGTRSEETRGALPSDAVRSVYVIGGQQRSDRPLLALPSWYEYQKGLVLQVDLGTGVVEARLDYASPPEVVPDEQPTILFKSGTLEGERLYVCTQTEVLVYRVPEFAQETYISLPCFNDLHHVRPTPAGTILVANTGLDMVLEVSLSGEIVRAWNALAGDPWSRFSRATDYRKIRSLKPHQSHPNYVFLLPGEIWATRFEQRDAICLTDPRRSIPIGLQRVHDGFVCGDRVYFTTVDGHIVIANAITLSVERVIDLNSMHPEGTILGWCRSILVDRERAWVGFSHFRPTKIRENVGWLTHGLRKGKPTHLACYDLSRGRCVAEINLEAHGLSSIFSILAVPSTSLARHPGMHAG